MPRIRTIKPEFPQSESMGRVSRDARLLFVQLWTLCDDSGRARGNSRMLASLLFPYDEDAPSLIDGWLRELEREGCILRYEADGSSYLQVEKWQQHQKIDKPSASKFPAPRECSRGLDDASRKIVQDQGPRTKDQGKDSAAQAAAPPQTPLDLKKALWATGVTYLTANGVSESSARSFIGLLRKSHDDVAIVDTFARAEAEGAVDPVAFIKATLAGKEKHAASAQGRRRHHTTAEDAEAFGRALAGFTDNRPGSKP